MKKKIKVVEPLWTGEKHSSFNAAFLGVLSHAFPASQIVFYGEKTHLSCVQKKFSGAAIDFKCIFNVRSDNKIVIPFLYIISVLQTIRFLLFTPFSQQLIFSGLSPFAYPMVLLLNFFFRRKIIFVCHGELAFIEKDTYRLLNGHYKLIAIMFKRAFPLLIKKSRIYLIVLGENIVAELKRYYNGDFTKNFLVIEHPYCLQPTESNTKSLPNNKLRLATVGLATRMKRADLIIEIHDRLKTKGILDKVQLEIIGKVADFTSELNGKKINYPDGKYFLDQGTYDKKISQQDFILFFYPDATYRLTPSGAFLDAVSHKKPVIVLKNNFFETYFNKAGQIGYMCDSIADMCECIEKEITNCSNGAKDTFGSNIDKLYQFFSIPGVAKSLRKQVELRGIIHLFENN
ncbi:hypothetical protein QTN47_13090 [Danxiaibacter flavus]|uniref:Glycosyl transferase family 1 domain-containing protein n=1 Tax=Danxiaibacter flavus TaxID=3049108 RepID=A0ABV3ZEX7_9BACT|nr:hypothetical protein QNM32_13095 [Chitinophagaceae bacterium DXS]